MTKQLCEVSGPLGEDTLAERERRQRASAPTLRDLRAAAQERLPALCAEPPITGLHPAHGREAAAPRKNISAA